MGTARRYAITTPRDGWRCESTGTTSTGERVLTHSGRRRTRALKRHSRTLAQ
jgi:hypothetical protein